MIYESADQYLSAPRKAVALFGMSGLGKTTIADLLRQDGDWFHYSVDYRIGTRYMDEHIADNFKRAAMQVPFLRELLMSDSIHITSNLSFENLAPLSTYLGKPGSPEKGGIPFAEYAEPPDEIASPIASRRTIVWTDRNINRFACTQQFISNLPAG